ncbi:MAG: DUF6029 family protein [Prevotellaceae bacterium]|nr:DUF6029 family protein [Prevotellaceae bacterium]
MKKILLYALALPVLATPAVAQENGDNNITVSGSIQSDILIPQDDDKIGTEHYSEWGLTNTYAEVSVQSEHIDGGARFEYTEHPLPGFENDFSGWGVPYIYLKTHFDKWDLTVGNFYEQFGSGFILRTYEERSLGIDNSLLGGRLVLRPVNGVTLKALSGKQRRYWSHNDAWVSGGDLELNFDQWFKSMSEKGTYLTLGASWVNKYEKDEDIMVDATHKLNLPTTVNAFDLRANLQTGGFNILGEYAWKTQDPSFDNGYIYRKGKVAMLSATYSKSGLSVLLQAKRSDNMSFRSSRSMNGTSSFINNLPAFTMEHTYTLAALYPYATHPDGEWAYQAEFGYRFKKGTTLGGKYGTSIKVNFSHVHAIDRAEKDGAAMGTDGYGSAFFKWGDQTYYQDLNVQFEKKMSSAFKLNLMYMNQFYNKTIVEGEGGMIHSDIFIAEGKYRFNNKFTLRGELQYLATDDDEGDWMFGLLELSVLPNWMFTISDEYNSGETNIHYYQGFVTFNKGSHRLQLGYGRTRAGYNCSGGVCRYVPASKGVTLSYNYNF